jgi:sortase B
MVKIEKLMKLYFVMFIICLTCMIIAIYSILLSYKGEISTKEAITEAKKQASAKIVYASDTSEVTKTTLPFLSIDFEPLKNRNSETVAWLRIASINVDMPIVQHTDNSFYLTKDIDNKENTSGWLFMSDACNPVVLGFNTVLYGHNMLNGQMFGTLKDYINTDISSVSGAGIIQLTTPDSEKILQICSVYITNSDDFSYVKTVFNAEEKEIFINKLQSKNEVKAFSTNTLTTYDNFVTLSTCYGLAGTNKRLVVVAKVIAER